MRFAGFRLAWLACIFCMQHVMSSESEEFGYLDSMVSHLALKTRINQMAQIDFSLLFTDGNIDKDKIEQYFGVEGIGSVLIVPVDGKYFDASFYSSVMNHIQDVAKKYKLPPVIAGVDSVHGANYIKNAIFFPQQINIASTFNTEHARYAGQVAANDTLAAGINWIFSPILGLGIQPLWARMYETFGEDPHLVGKMASQMVQGIQESGRVAACAKHFVGYSAPRTGHDRAPSWIPVRQLYQYFLRPWREVIENANPLTIMESYTEYDGVPIVSNRDALQTLLRQDLGFDGVLVTDYHEIENLFEFHKVAEDNDEAVQLAFQDGSVDMSMIPFNTKGWMSAVLAGVNGKNAVKAKANISRAVKRILAFKEKLFDEVHSNDTFDYLENIGDTSVRKAAMDIAVESIILAENNDKTLPILSDPNENKIKVHVTGPTSDSLKYQTGGWSIEWQGGKSDDDFTYGKTVLDAAKDIDTWDVTSSCGVNIMGDPCDGEDVSTSNKQRGEADYIIVCIGEENYTGKYCTETISFSSNCVLFLTITFIIKEKPGDIRDLNLAEGQRDYVDSLKEVTNAKIIVVYFGGRPRLLGDVVDVADAIMIAFLPGPDAGEAALSLITGKENFSGKFPITYPKFQDMGGVPYWHAVSDQCTGPEDGNDPLPHYWYKKCDVEWSFGHGKSYTTFDYSNVKTDSTELYHSITWDDQKIESSVTISANVKNTGDRKGTETVMFFVFIENRHVTPEYKLLLHFEKVELDPGEEKSIEHLVTPSALKHIGPNDDKHDILQMGEKFRIGVGPHADCRSDNKEFCSDLITLEMSGSEDYDPACQKACSLLKDQQCLEDLLSIQECYETCLSSESPTNVDEHGWGWSYVNCIESIFLDRRRKNYSKCEAARSLCRDVLSDFATEKPVVSEGPVLTDDTPYPYFASFISIVSILCLIVVISIPTRFLCVYIYNWINDTNRAEVDKTSIEFTSVSQNEVV